MFVLDWAGWDGLSWLYLSQVERMEPREKLKQRRASRYECGRASRKR